ncbi:MAG: 30S ribosomal protein S8 [Thermoplasmata archaeon]|jgi:small subunit ribosomal protein S8|nr:30S ribosomal protein S8 [Thermoplasmata archaeon]MCI4338625.1 30S ribosomal protein S8 [Thermoplasmata archaeon]MCI4341964.1 30S ribosomal protein S8 [Thermoplasmata archaeon]
MQHDLLNDALVTLRHADQQGQGTVSLKPTSKLIGEVLRIFQENQYISEFTFLPNGRGGEYQVKLARRINSCGVIKPRMAVRGRALERYEARFLPAQDFGLLLLSTNQGVMSHAKARELKIGGKLLAYVY